MSLRMINWAEEPGWKLEEKQYYKCEIAPGLFYSGARSRPCLFHRVMQRLFLGWKWSKHEHPT